MTQAYIVGAHEMLAEAISPRASSTVNHVKVKP